MSMGGSVRLRRNTVRLASDHCPACVGLLSGIDRKPCPPCPECASERATIPSRLLLASIAEKDRSPSGRPGAPRLHSLSRDIVKGYSGQRAVSYGGATPS